MEYRVLGPLEVDDGEGPLALGGAQQRTVLLLLLLSANHAVSRDRLIDALWGDDPPETAVTSVQVYVSRLRKLLPDGTLVTRGRAYALEVEPDSIDLARFERLVAESRQADPDRASQLLREALALWRGAALPEFDEPFAQIEAGRLEDLRLAALEERIECDLARGCHTDLIGELEVLIAEHPHRERLRGQLMLALYRSGRQAEALAAYRDARAALDELGVEPSAELRRLEKQILTQDASLVPRERLLSAPAGDRVPLPGPLVTESPFPFVGRKSELAALRLLLERAESGEGGFVLLSGEAGAGKTRLVRELAHDAAARGVLVLYGGSDAAVSTPYQPLREWLEFLARVSDPAALRASLGTCGEHLSRIVPSLGSLVGNAPQPHEAEDRYLLQTAAAEFLRRLSEIQPLLLVADDVHWSDSETQHLLRRLARTAPEARVLLVVAFRDTGEDIGPELADALTDMSRLDAVTRLGVGNLDTDEVGDFIRASTDANVSHELAVEMGEITDGMPLLLCELWRDLRDAGSVEFSNGDVHVSQPLTERRGPERIRDFVGQRLSRLSPETNGTVELAAVAGRQFELAVLGEAAGLEAAALLGKLDEAAAMGLLEALPGPVPAWRFTHELLRRAVYDRLKHASRAELHRRIGEALEHAHADDPSRVLPELAHHFTLAVPLVEVERAVAYNLHAAEAAIASAADQEGAARLSTALELGIADPRQRARVQVDLAHLLGETLRGYESAAMLAAGLEAATNLGDRALVAEVLLQRTHARLQRDPTFDPTEAETVARAAIETFREIGNERDLALAERRLGLALLHQGRVEDECAVLERALVHADASGDRRARRMVVASLVNALFNGPAPVLDAIRRCEELLDSTRNDRVLKATVTRGLSALVAMAGRFDEAGELVRESSLVLDELNLLTRSVYRLMAATAKELIGDRVGAEHELTAAWQGLSSLRADAVDARAMNAAYDLARLYCDEGRWEDAERCLDYGRDVGEIKKPFVGALRFAVSARVAAHRGEHAQALELAQRGVELAERSDLLNLRASVWLALAEVQRYAGAEADARTSVAGALDLYELKGNVAAAAALRTDAALDSSVRAL